MADEEIGYIIGFFIGIAVIISLTVLVTLIFLAFLIIFIPLVIFGYVKTKNKRRCPYCSISMDRVEEEEKKVFQCPECLRVFRDKPKKKIEKQPKKKIEKQDYMNSGWLRHQYYELGKTLQEIADEQNVSMITIKKWVDKVDPDLNNQTDFSS